MKLYYAKGACSLAVRITLHEMNIPCAFEAVNLKTKQTETGMDYLNINTKGAVPAQLVNTHELLTENAVIQQYLAETYQATRLLPPINTMERYHVLEWLNYISTDLHKGCSPFFNPNLPEDLKETTFRPALKNKFAVVDQRL